MVKNIDIQEINVKVRTFLVTLDIERGLSRGDVEHFSLTSIRDTHFVRVRRIPDVNSETVDASLAVGTLHSAEYSVVVS